ncbi:MAG: 50S ribosomal protein L20 [Chlamydiae bacterium SM23_39]|nr:MAG: 50S ribosomal protein L20 [Chlamydiae bacterium SM23_39]
MSRATNAKYSNKKRKRLFKKSKGFWGDRKNHIRLTKDAVMKALMYNYEHRKQKKRNFRKLWTIRINVGARINGISYSKFINGLKKSKCNLNRKILAELAISDPKAFSEIAKISKQSFA